MCCGKALWRFPPHAQVLGHPTCMHRDDWLYLIFPLRRLRTAKERQAGALHSCTVCAVLTEGERCSIQQQHTLLHVSGAESSARCVFVLCCVTLGACQLLRRGGFWSCVVYRAAKQAAEMTAGCVCAACGCLLTDILLHQLPVSLSLCAFHCSVLCTAVDCTAVQYLGVCASW
jgi:hypothetical protein